MAVNGALMRGPLLCIYIYIHTHASYKLREDFHTVERKVGKMSVLSDSPTKLYLLGFSNRHFL
jgi:hypothetical protein